MPIFIKLRKNYLMSENESNRQKVLPYIGTDAPAMIFIMIDQSASMKDYKKSEFASDAVNKVIYEIILSCQSGKTIRDRSFVTILGYGKSIEVIRRGSTSALESNKVGTKEITEEMSNGAGGYITAKMTIPYWVKPVHDNGTPMSEAIEVAYPMIETFVNDFPNSHPPVVINITDGVPNDWEENSGSAPQTESSASKLKNLASGGFNLIFLNVHITGDGGRLVLLPSREADLQDSYSKLLFRMSSELPDQMVNVANLIFNKKFTQGARGMAFNADAGILVKFLTFGS